jgi:hypothetical protein
MNNKDIQNKLDDAESKYPSHIREAKHSDATSKETVKEVVDEQPTPQQPTGTGKTLAEATEDLLNQRKTEQ